MKTKKRLLSILLSLALVLGMLPGMSLTAYADEEYALWIYDTRVTSANANDVFGDGTVSYVPEDGNNERYNATLTLNGYKYTGQGVDAEDQYETRYSRVIYYNGDAPLQIILKGQNTINNTSDNGDNAYGIYSESDNLISIGGDGSLDITAYNYGIYCLRDLAVAGTIKAIAFGSGDCSGISSGSFIIADNVKSFIASGDNRAVDCRGGAYSKYGGIGWTNVEGTEGRTDIESIEGEVSLNYKKVQFATYTVTFNTNGGTINSGNITKYLGSSGATLPTDVTKDDCQFAGWYDNAGLTGNPVTAISTSDTGNKEYWAKWTTPHTHSFTYSASGATITASCGADGCTLPASSAGAGDHVATLTIGAPTLTYVGQTGDGISANATLTGLEDFNTATGKTIAATDIKYVGRDGTSYAESGTAPTNAGKYTAKITVEEKTARVDYEIDKATPIATNFTYNAPSDLTYDGNAKAATVESTQTGMGAVTVKYYSDEACSSEVESPTDVGTYYVGITVEEGDNYSAVSTVLHDESWKFTINRAMPSTGSFTYEAPSDLTYDGNAKTATVVGASGMGDVTVKYYSDAECTSEMQQTPTNVGTYYVGITVAEGDNYSAVSDVLHDSSWRFTINKATPIATNFTYNAPSDLTYDGNAKSATVVPKDGITGMGNVTVKYYSDQYCTEEVPPTNVGTYYVGITLDEGNNYHDASSAFRDDDWSFTITKAAETAPAADTTNLNINYSEETISAKRGYEVAADNNGTSITNLTSILENGTPTVYIRKTASDNNHDHSAWVAVTLAARPDAPNGLSTENASNGGTADGKIKGTTVAMEYKQKDSEGEWTTATANETAVVPGTYIVRVKATDAAPHGKATEVTVGSNYKALDDSTTVTIKKGESELSGVPVVDDVLTVSCEASDVTYQWYRGDEAISEASGKSYTITKDDVGKVIKVVATQTKDSNGQEITGTKPTKDSAATSAVVKKTPETLSTDDAKTKAGINYQTEQAAPDSGYEVSTDGTNKTESPISLTGIIDSESPKIYVRTAENDDTAAGAWVEVTIVARPDEPTGLTTESANTATSQDGKIKGTTGNMEYKLKGSEGAWTTATAGETLVASGTYLIRTKASSDKPAGKTAEMAVGSKEIILTDAQKPTAKTGLTYTGSEQALINAPAADLPKGAKEMRYAIGTDATTAPTDGWSTTLPVGKDAKTYYVWYKVVGDENHNDSTAECIPVTISNRPSGGGSSGSGEGSGTTYTVPVTNESTVQVNVSINNGNAAVNEIKAEDIAKITTVGEDQKPVDTINIDLSGASVEVTSIELTKSTVENLADAVSKNENLETVTVVLSNAVATLDQKTLETMVSEAKGNTIKLVVDDVEQTKLNDKQQDALKVFGSAEPFEVYFESNGHRISDFGGGRMAISLKFTPATGRDPKNYFIVYLNPDGSVKLYPSTFKDGAISTVIDHNSEYAVVYDDSRDKAAARKVKIKSAKAKKGRKALVKWKKLKGVSGYQIAYSTSKKFSKKTTKRVTASAKSAKKTIKKLKAGKRYYVKVRSYNKIYDPAKEKKVNVYGKWSKVKKFKAKK